MKNIRFQLFIALFAMMVSAAFSSAQTPIPTPPTAKTNTKAAPPAAAAITKATPSPTPMSPVSPAASLAEIIDKPDVRSLKLNSKLMGREMPYRVIVPRDYEFLKTARFPVVYLLHGLTGHFDNWTDRTKVAQYLTGFNYIVVTPEGGDGWYTDSVTVPSDRYESYIVKELIPEIDKTFRTKTARENRAIAGLSMGGYGALKFGLKYPDQFILAGSFSGALSITALPAATANYPSVRNVYGPDDSQNRKDNDIFRIIRDMPAEKLKELPFLYIACGTEDFLFSSNQDFMKLLSEKKVKHEYRQLPGAHTWNFWDAQVAEFLRMSDKFIQK